MSSTRQRSGALHPAGSDAASRGHLRIARGEPAVPRDPLIVDIKRYSVADGPGIRSVVFFKGCTLACKFCQNPEAQKFAPEVAFFDQRCIECGDCVPVCPSGATSLEWPKRIDRLHCDACGLCADACPSGALERVGVAYTPQALVEILLRDRHYYLASGGGVTLSGGEPALFPEYVGRLVEQLDAEDIHIVLQTSGHFFDWPGVRSLVLPHVDLVQLSVRAVDPVLHQRITGHPNQQVIANLYRLAREPGVTLEAAIPIVPGMTDSRENLTSLVALLRDAGVKTVRLLEYNPLGISTAASLGRPRPDAPTSFMAPEALVRVRQMFEEILAQPRMPVRYNQPGMQWREAT